MCLAPSVHPIASLSSINPDPLRHTCRWTFENQPAEDQRTNPSQAPVSMAGLRIEASIAVKVSMMQAKVHWSNKLTHQAFELLHKGEGGDD